MFYVKNLPLWERTLRIGGGVVLAAYAILSLSGMASWGGIVAGLGMALTGVIGFCPACAMVGRRLDKQMQAARN